MKSNIIIFSGIEPGKKGAGNLVSFFEDRLLANRVKFELHYTKTPDGFFVKQFKNSKYKWILKSLYYSLSRTISSSRDNIVDKKVILFHPQSIGLKKSVNLIKSNFVYIYVLDNFLFCRKSYNYLNGNNSCLLCLKNKDSHKIHSCDFFPVKQKADDYDDFLNTIASNLSQIHFLTQNKNQSNLVIQKFGSVVNLTEIGMLVDLNEDFSVNNSNVNDYDFLYHNTLSESKGLKYFLSIAKLMPDYSFIVPYSQKDVRKLYSDYEDLENVDFLPISWDTGLKEILINSKIVINPSLWSAPVEGALLKSIKYNGSVAVVSAEYSFQAELPKDMVIMLPSELNEATEILKKVVDCKQSRLNLKSNSKIWLTQYINKVNTSFDKFISDEFCKGS